MNALLTIGCTAIVGICLHMMVQWVLEHYGYDSMRLLVGMYGYCIAIPLTAIAFNFFSGVFV